MKPDADFQKFCKVWLSDVREGNPSTIELGRRFARKLISQWLDIDELSNDIVHCDGNRDGGIDIAYLHRGETADELYQDGDTWYLVQSKYGKSFSGTKTLLEEAQKLFETLDGKRKSLSSLTQDLLERLHIFLSKQSEDNRLVFVFATDKPLNQKEKYALSDIRAMGRDRFGERFEVETVSIETIYQRTLESNRIDEHLEISLKGNFVKPKENLLVGSVTLRDLYDFLKGYYIRTGDLDRLYEKNLRLFLGIRGKVNKSIKETLDNKPEEFGFYNNGVTIVVESVEKMPYGRFNLINPSVVNGCQTTQTIYKVLFNKLEAGGKGSNPSLEKWKERIEQGIVIVKIVKVSSQGESLLLENITRCTNSQNAVREKDFLALASGFRVWQRRMDKKYHVFLEIQRGSWDAHKASQTNENKLTESANIYDLLKVYGAGWLGEAGLALYGKSQPFVQGGSVYEKIVNHSESTVPFGVDDLYAAYLLQNSLKTYNFGRGKNCRKITTRFLFFMVVVELLKAVMLKANIKQTNADITQSLLKLFKKDNDSVCNDFLEMAAQFIDEYTHPSIEEDYSVFKEPYFSEGTNLLTYLKNDKIGKDKEYSPIFISLLANYKRLMKRKVGKQPSLFNIVLDTITNESQT